MKAADPKAYEEMITRWLKLKRQGRLFPTDIEPDPKDYGLISWAADQIKARVQREVSR